MRFCGLDFTEYNTEYPTVELTGILFLGIDHVGRLPQLTYGRDTIGSSKIIPFIQSQVTLLFCLDGRFVIWTMVSTII